MENTLKCKMNNKHFHDTLLPWGEGRGGVKGKGEIQERGEIFVVVYFTFPFILRPLTIKTKHKPTFVLMKLRTGVAPPPPLYRHVCKKFVFYTFSKFLNFYQNLVVKPGFNVHPCIWPKKGTF